MWGVSATYSIVHGLVLASAERHVSNGALGAVPGDVVLGHKVDTCNDARVAARATVVEHLDGVQLGLLGDSVGDGADCAGTVGTVAWS